MGVLMCDRMYCENILCQRCSEQHGYICDECFEELVRSGAETNIAKFMGTSENLIDESASRARFEIEFPYTLRDDV